MRRSGAAAATSTDADAVVVGAGPAGAAAAIVLARAGWQVTLADRARFPRDKCCGDGLTAPALEQLFALGLDPSRVPSWRSVSRSVFRSPSGREVPLRTDGGRRGALAVATRCELDAELLEVARRAGAQVLEGAKLEAAAVSGATVELGFGGAGSLRAPFVVAADGAWSPTRRALEPAAAELPKWQAARTYVEGVSGPAATEARVWFDPDLLPGYAWSFPLAGGRANVGVGALRDAGGGGGWLVKRMTQLLASDHVRQFLGTDAGLDASRPLVWPIPTELTRAHLIDRSGRVLFAGDAAAATDPMTGEGIAEALQTGTLAAEALIADRSRSYANRAGRALAWRHRRRQLCSDLLGRRSLAVAGLRVADTSPWTRTQFTRWIFG